MTTEHSFKPGDLLVRDDGRASAFVLQAGGALYLSIREWREGAPATRTEHAVDWSEWARIDATPEGVEVNRKDFVDREGNGSKNNVTITVTATPSATPIRQIRDEYLAAENRCRGCGAPLSPSSRSVLCPHCRSTLR